MFRALHSGQERAMNFGFTEEQERLRAEARRLLQLESPMPAVRRAAGTPLGYDPALWQRLAALGFVGLLVPERHGGGGLGWVEVIVLLEATGQTLLPSPLLSTLLASAALKTHGDEAQQARYLPRIARGELIATLALLERSQRLDVEGVQTTARRDGDGYVLAGEKAFVHDAGSAGLFVVAARGEQGVGLFLIEREQPGVVAENHSTIDSTKRMGNLRLSDVHIGKDAVLVAPPAGEAALECLLDAGAVAVAAEAVGAATAAHALTVAYAKERKQFGAPIGKFQGVKHPLAEMYVEIETARSLVYCAAWALDAAPEAVPRAASMAKAYTSECFARVGIDAIQLHGAIGYTEEYDAQLYLKRSKWARPQFGDADHHYDRIARLGGA
jgi:alkylation response protein AidB-like acyl-CoA dehydrogenase